MEETKTRIDLPGRKYRLRMHFCQKPNCLPCRQGTGHGPYWYVCERVNGRVVQRYLGKTLPAEAHVAQAPFAALSEMSDPSFRLYTLGAFRLEYWQERWEPLTHAALPQVRRLLSYLLSCPERHASRTHVLETLWPSHAPTDAALLLRKTIHTLATVLAGLPHVRLDAVFQIQDEHLYLAGQDRLWVDATAFEALLTMAKHASPNEQERHLLEAAALYQGEFFAEERQADWVTTRRQSLHQTWATLLLDLAHRALERGDVLTASTSLQRVLAANPLHGGALERLMTLLIAQENRSEAFRLYMRFAEHKETSKEQAEALLRRVQDAPPLELPHVPEKKAIVRLLPVLDPPPVSPPQRHHCSALVGRTRELEELRASLNHTAHPRLLCLMGEAGIGKTRLVEALLSDIRQRGWNTVWSRSYAEERRMPYRLWSSVLHTLLEQFSWPWQQLCERPAVFRPLIALLPALRERLPEGERSVQTPQQEERLLWEAIHELLIVLSTARPLLIVLDDLHWVDSGSAQVLIALLRQLHPTILLLATCRLQELHEQPLLCNALTEGQRDGTVTLLSLPPLEEVDTRVLIGQQVQLSAEQIQTLAARSGGNPFFAEELARQAQHQAQQGPALEGKEQSGDQPLPESIHAVLSLRLSHLSAPCQRLLGKAAVLGHAFTLPVIAAMEAQGVGVQEEALLDLLDEALSAGLISEDGSTHSIVYQFWHPLLVSHLLGELSAARRARYHRQAVQALRQVYRGACAEEQAATIVHHLLEGGAPVQELAEAAEQAGNYAYRLSVYPEAAYYYRLAVQHLDEQAAAERRLSLLEHLGECMMIQGQYPEARQIYERALAGVEQQEGNADDIRYRAQHQALLWCEIGWTWRYVGEPERAHECRRAAEQVLDHAGVMDGPARASLKYQEGSLLWQEGRYQEALATAQEALALFEQHLALHPSTHHETGPNTRIERTLAGDFINFGRVLTLHASIEGALGKNRQAILTLKKALTLFDAHHCIRESTIASVNIGNLYLMVGQYDEARAAFQQSLTLAQRIGDFPIMCVNEGNLGILSDRLGAVEQAEVSLREALHHAQRVQDTIYISFWSAFLAGTLSKQRRFPEALRSLRQAYTQGRGFLPCINRARLMLSKMRIEYILFAGNTLSHGMQERLLQASEKTLRRQCIQTDVDVEERIEGQLLLAHVLFLQHQTESARQIAIQVYQDAVHYELPWLLEHQQTLLNEYDPTY